MGSDAAAAGPLVRAISGAAALALAMGVGRFAYTALLPSVQRGIGLDDAGAGAVASVNLVGYLVGVLWGRAAAAGRRRAVLLRLGLAASVLTTAAVAGATGFAGWMGLRFVSGVASGLVFVLVSAAVLEALPVGREQLVGVLYAGVGGGIALSGCVAAGATGVGWPVPWLLLGAVSAVLAVPAWWQARPPVRASRATPTSAAGDGVSLGRLGAAYFLEGLGYIVSGTFAVAAVQRRPELAAWAPWVWVAAGTGRGAVRRPVERRGAKGRGAEGARRRVRGAGHRDVAPGALLLRVGGHGRRTAFWRHVHGNHHPHDVPRPGAPPGPGRARRRHAHGDLRDRTGARAVPRGIALARHGRP